MKKLMSTIGILALFAGTGFAQNSVEKAETKQERGHHGKQGGFMEDIPDLTETQKTQLKEIKQASKEGMKSQKEDLRNVKEKLGTLKTAQNPNLSEINAQIDKKHKLEAEMDKAKVASYVKMRSVLTPAQLKVFDAKMKEKREKRKEEHKEHREMKQMK